MGLAERRTRTDKIIKKRLKIVKEWKAGMVGIVDKYPVEDLPHSLHKFNLNCGCKMCHYYKHIGNSKKKYKHSELKKIEEMIDRCKV